MEQVLTLTQKDLPDILALMQLIQPHLPRTQELLNWQYFECPHGVSRLYGMRDQNKLVAIYTGITNLVQVGSDLKTARMIQDVMTHPDYRGRGYLHLLAERCLQDMLQAGELGFTFPNEKSENSFRRTGWRELGRVPLRNKAPRSKTLDTQALKLNEGFTEVSDTFHSSVDEIWKNAGLPVGVARTAKYLNWRYQKPGVTYHKYLIGNNTGYLVLKYFNSGTDKNLHICDLLVKKEKINEVENILRFIENLAIENNVSQMTAWLSEIHPYSYAFNQFGLRLKPEYFRYVFVCFPDPKDEVLANIGLWQLTQGDSDVY